LQGDVLQVDQVVGVVELATSQVVDEDKLAANG
jgi:hypothetical protein